MTRRVRYHPTFAADLAAQVRWLRAQRPDEHRTRLRSALTAFIQRIGRFPAIAREIERRGSVSYRAAPASDRLPYIIWYSYDDAEPVGPISLLRLFHEAQDRERFDPPEVDV